MTKKEELTQDEQVRLKNALEHIEELEHLMQKRPVEVFKTLLKMNIPMALEIGMEGGIHTIRFNDSD